MKKIILVISLGFLYILNAGESKIDDITTCKNRLKTEIPKLSKFLEYYYIAETKQSENSVLKEYKKLRSLGISSDLVKLFDPVLIQKLTHSKSVDYYNRIIIRELRKIELELKKNNPLELNTLVKKIQFLMFAWTSPMEILSTKKIYNDSLLDMSQALYTSINKEKYKDYSEYIYSLFSYTISENFDTAPEVRSAIIAYNYGITVPKLSDDDEYRAITVCNLLDATRSLGESFMYQTVFVKIEGYMSDELPIKVEEFTSKKVDFVPSIIFKKGNFREIDIRNNPLSDEWNIIIREYIKLQKHFYGIKKEITKIIKILESLPETEDAIFILDENLMIMDSLYRKLDEIVRYNVIDLPISIYADLFKQFFDNATGWINDDEKMMADVAVLYNKSNANMQKYMVRDFTIKKVLKVTKRMKKEFNEEEWKEILTRAKLTQDWFNMLNKIEIRNK